MVQNNRNVSIQLVRIVAMLMIIIDHLLFFIDLPNKAIIIQISNSGVLIFLFISGLLFGQQEIDDWKNWFLKRLIRICIPVWAFVCVDLVVEQILYNRFSIKYIFIYLFNVEGFIAGTPGGIPLWFITLILICYLITPLLYKLKRMKISKTIIVLIVCAVLVIQIVLAYTTNIGMVYGHKLSWCVIALGIYALGYYVGDIIIKQSESIIKLLLAMLIMILSSVAIIFLNKYIDNTVLYNDIIVWYGIAIVDLWIILFVYKIGSLEWAKHIRKVINYLDNISFEFYIVHYLIIMTITLPLGSKIGSFGYILLTIVLSLVGGTILHYICQPIIKVMKNRLVKE